MYRSWNRRTVVSLGSCVGFAGLALIAFAGCAPGPVDDLQVEHRQDALMGSNGLTLNGLTLNGLTLNGLTLNGLTLNGLTLNGLTLNGASMSADEKAGAQVLISYMAECALPEGEQVTVLDRDGEPLVLDGMFGLAPEWASGPLSSRGQHLLSACLAARINTEGKHVHISLRGAGVDTTPVERALYTHHEGAFWGNLFGDDPGIYSCAVEGAGISGRSCTDGDCGFQSMGSCAKVCSGSDPVDGHFASCAGEELVLSTFLVATDDIDFGTAHGCIVRNGKPWCWGENSHGQLGSGAGKGKGKTARPVSGHLDADVVEISGGSQHTCARGADGSAWCWGDNARGQLGVDQKKKKLKAPAAVSQLGHDVASIAAGADHTCALTTDGQAWCWGDNSHGQLGSSDSKNLERSPILVEALGNDVARIAAGESSAHTCAIDNAGTLSCWGANSDGQLGDNSRKDRSVPVQIASTASGAAFDEITDACTGALHTCARRADGSVWCWGGNDAGQVGNGAQSHKPVKRPLRVAIEGGVAQGTLSCGANHTCAIHDDGSLQCWGDNSKGQLGNGNMKPENSVPGPVAGLDAVPVRVSASADRTCALLDDESIWCWGRDAGRWFVDQAVSAIPLPGTMFQ